MDEVLPQSYRESLGLEPYVPVNRDNRATTHGVIVEVLGWIITISSLFLMGMFLNWYLYTRHERIDRVFVEPIEVEEEEEEEEKLNSVDERAIDTY